MCYKYDKFMNAIDDVSISIEEFNKLIDESGASTPQNSWGHAIFDLTGHNLIWFRWKDIEKLIPISKTAWYDGIKAGTYPQPSKKFGSKVSVWHADDLLPLFSK